MDEALLLVVYDDSGCDYGIYVKIRPTAYLMPVYGPSDSFLFQVPYSTTSVMKQ